MFDLIKNAGLATPLVKDRLNEFTKATLTKLNALELNDPTAYEINAAIKSRCQKTLWWFAS